MSFENRNTCFRGSFCCSKVSGGTLNYTRALTALRHCSASAGARKQRRLCCSQPQMRSQAAQTCSQSRAQRPQHSRARNTHASRPILATPSPESTNKRAKGTNSRREPPSAPPSAPEPLTSCTPSLVGIKTGLFWYSPALAAAPGAPCALKRSSQPSCPKRLQAR